MGFINGEESAPPSKVKSGEGKEMVPNPDFQARIKIDRLVKAWIASTLSEDAFGSVVSLVTAEEDRDSLLCLLNSF